MTPRNFVVRSLAIGGTVAYQLLAQAPQLERGPASLPKQFEVASIRLAPEAEGTPGDGGYFIAPGGRFIGSRVRVQKLIQEAYGVSDFQISGGPGWIGSARYDIDARAEGWSTPEQLKPLVQALLADRFSLKVHRETRKAPIYALVVAKNRPKLTASKEANGPSIGGGPGRIRGLKVQMALFCTRLSLQLGRAVVDKTGLKGEYDLTLEWAPPEGTPNIAAANNPDNPPLAPSGPSIFTALEEQLGLKLEGQEGEIESIVIDRIERPTEN